jgi:MFS family permease
MVGLGEVYIPAFALALGHGELAAGLVATAPVLAGALLQLLTPAGVRWAGTHRRWTITCALLQAAAFAPLVLGSLSGQLPLSILLVVSALYWAAGYSAGSAWNGWMAALIPTVIRARYFADRARFAQAALAVSLLGGGAMLHLCSGRGAALLGFALLFGLACSCRLLSSQFLTRQSEVPEAPGTLGTNVSLELLRSLRRGPSGRLFAYLIAVQLAVNVCAPYFTPYMLRQLELSYGGFVMLTAAAFLSRIAVMPLLGRVAQRHGARRLLRLAGIAVVPLSGMWVVSDNFVYLLGLQMYAGVAWASYEFAVLLLFIGTLDHRDRVGLLSLYNLANAVAMFGGSLVGGFLLDHLGMEHLAYSAIFIASSAARFLTLALLRRIPEARVLRPPVSTRALAARPSLKVIPPRADVALAPADDGALLEDEPEGAGS